MKKNVEKIAFLCLFLFSYDTIFSKGPRHTRPKLQGGVRSRRQGQMPSRQPRAKSENRINRINHQKTMRRGAFQSPQLQSVPQPSFSSFSHQPVTASLDQFFDASPDFSRSTFSPALLSNPSIPLASASGSMNALRGCVKVVDGCRNMPSFRVLFDGRETMNNQNGLYCFPIDEKYIDSYGLVICAQVVPHFDKRNTVKSIGIIPDEPYRYFRFRQNRITSQWEMQEKRLYRENFMIPDHTVVLLIDPELIDYIEPWEISLQESNLKLPLVVLKNIGKDQLEKESAWSLLSSLDHGSFHQEVREEKKEIPEKKIVTALPG